MKKIFWPIAILMAILAAVIVKDIKTVMERVKISEGLARGNKPYTQNLPQSEQRILILGDSAAAGVGADNPRDSIAGRLGADFPEAYVINQGMPGRDLSELLADFPRYPTKHLKLAVIMVGANDIINFTRIKNIERDLRLAVEKATLMANHVLILHSGNLGVAPFFPKTIGWIYTLRTLQVRRAYQRVAQETGVIYVDLYASRRDDPFLKDTAKFYASDGLHLTDEGYGVWHKKIRAAMQDANIKI